MKISFSDSRKYFKPTTYQAVIKNAYPSKTKYGTKLLVWYEITNQYQEKMMVNDFFNYPASRSNRLGHFIKLIYGEKHAPEIDTDDLKGRMVAITLQHKHRKGRSYLNVVAYKKAKKEAVQGELAEEARKALEKLKDIAGKKGGTQSIGDILKDMQERG